MATEYNVHKQNNMNQRFMLMKSREEMQGNKLVLKLLNN